MSTRQVIAAAGGAGAGIAGGLIGLGGAEFRVPLLAGVLRVPLRELVPLNLAVSLCVVLAALPLRLFSAEAALDTRYLPLAAAMAGGAVAAAWFGAGLLGRMDAGRLRDLIRLLLVVLGVILLLEAVFPLSGRGLFTGGLLQQVLVGPVIGLGIGLVSSLLGVAGGELIIPALVLGFGVPVKAAGTLSILISMPAMIVGLLRYQRLALVVSDSSRRYFRPLMFGSIAGALLGASLVGLVPAAALKAVLGVLLVWSAWKAVPAQKKG